MKREHKLMASGVLALVLGTGLMNAQVTIIGGATGNGNFNAGGGGTAGGAQTYDATANWFNAQGAETVNFTQSSQMGGSSDPDNGVTTRGGMPFNNRTQVNDTGYTIGAGDVGKFFSLRYDFGAGGGLANWENMEDMHTFLFTTGVPVDGNITDGDMAEFGGDVYAVDRAADGQWTIRTVMNFYTIAAGDVGKTVYFGMRFVDNGSGASLFPRIDLIELTLNDALVEPIIAVVDTPEVVSVVSPATTGTTSFTIRNDATTQQLDVTAIGFSGGTGFSLVSPGLPINLAPGATQLITVEWDSAAAGDTFEAGTATLTSNDPTNGTVDVSVNAGVATEFSKVLPNWDFETLGTAPNGGIDAFASWEEEIVAGRAASEEVLNVPGLLTGSTAAYLGGRPDLPVVGEGGIISGDFSTPLSNFVITADFAVSANTGGERAFNIIVTSTGGGGENVNIRYQSGTWAARHTDNLWYPLITAADLGVPGIEVSTDDEGNGSLDDAFDVKNVYKLKLTCTGWGTSTPISVFEIQDDTGTPMATSEPFSYFRGALPTDGNSLADEVEFTAVWSNNTPPSWVDNVCVDGSVLDTVVAPAPPLVITDFTIDPATGMGSVTFDSVDGVGYDLRASSDAGATDPFAGNLVTSGAGTGASTTLNFTDAGAVGQVDRYYRVEEQP